MRLFKSKRQKVKEDGTRVFENYLPSLKGVSGEEIGFLLDTAKRIKDATTMYGEHKDDLLLFEDPLLAPETTAFNTIEMWKKHMLQTSGTIEGRAKSGALSIWYLSLVSCHIAELRIQGRTLWKELERGFPFVQLFDPLEDVVNGLEPMDR